MKKPVLSLLCFLAVSVNSHALKEYNDLHYRNYGNFIEDIIKDAVNSILNAIADPLTIPEISSDFGNNESLSGAFNVTNARLDGARGIAITHLKCDPFGKGSINITINVGDINLNFKYWANIVVGDLIPLYGAGRNK
ncbi:hypothetical protein JTB14_018055 [Gonioctena quinquepunctata]|nr:hypothetical protein JTB14_018055 [Gonioctena quinquepunctata]